MTTRRAASDDVGEAGRTWMERLVRGRWPGQAGPRAGLWAAKPGLLAVSRLIVHAHCRLADKLHAYQQSAASRLSGAELRPVCRHGCNAMHCYSHINSRRPRGCEGPARLAAGRGDPLGSDVASTGVACRVRF